MTVQHNTATCKQYRPAQHSTAPHSNTQPVQTPTSTLHTLTISRLLGPPGLFHHYTTALGYTTYFALRGPGSGVRFPPGFVTPLQSWQAQLTHWVFCNSYDRFLPPPSVNFPPLPTDSQPSAANHPQTAQCCRPRTALRRRLRLALAASPDWYSMRLHKKRQIRAHSTHQSVRKGCG